MKDFDDYTLDEPTMSILGAICFFKIYRESIASIIWPKIDVDMDDLSGIGKKHKILNVISQIESEMRNLGSEGIRNFGESNDISQYLAGMNKENLDEVDEFISIMRKVNGYIDLDTEVYIDVS